MSRRIFKRGGLALLAAIAMGAVFLFVQGSRRRFINTSSSLNLPAADATAPIQVRFAGVTTLVFEDGETAWMVDRFFTRPAAMQALIGKVKPDRDAIDRNLAGSR